MNFAKQNSTHLRLKPKTMFPQNLFLLLLVKFSSQNQIQNLAKSIDRLVEQQNLGKFRQNLREWSKHARRIRDMKRFKIMKAKKYFFQLPCFPVLEKFSVALRVGELNLNQKLK